MQEFPVYGWLELVSSLWVPLVVYPLIVAAVLFDVLRTAVRKRHLR